MSKQKEKAIKYAYPSRFGSHKSMQVKELGEGKVLCEDEHGQYITESKYLDKNTTDPNRCAESRLTKLFAGRKKEEK